MSKINKPERLTSKPQSKKTEEGKKTDTTNMTESRGLDITLYQVGLSYGQGQLHNRNRDNWWLIDSDSNLW